MTGRRRRPVLAAWAIALLAASCTGSTNSGSTGGDRADTIPTVSPVPPASARAAPSTLATVTQPSSTSTSTSTSTSVPTTIAAVRTVTMAFSGDTLAHSPLWRRAARNAAGDGHDFTPMLAQLAPILGSVDLAVCHLETPIAPEGEEYSTMPLYGVPVEIVDALARAGYDRCSTASNHTADRGGPGIDRTVAALEAAGIAQSGMARTPEEIEPRPFEVNGISLAHLSYTFSYNGLSLPEGEEWRSATIDPERMIADAARARQLGAEVVVMSIHWGAEGQSSPTTEQRRVADLVTASGQVDLIVGHHAHVVQPIETVNGTWVVFGLGNILSNLPTSDRWPASSQDGEIVTVALSVDPDGAVTVARPVVHPTWVDKADGWIVRPVLSGLVDESTSARIRRELEASLARTMRVVGDFVAESPTPS